MAATTSRVLFRHDECFVYRIPPESFSSAGHRAATWGLEKPFITARVTLTEEDRPVPVPAPTGAAATAHAPAATAADSIAGSGRGGGGGGGSGGGGGRGAAADDDKAEKDDDDDDTDMESVCTIKLYKGKKLFAVCEIDMREAGDKGLAHFMQQVTDSSRYWVLRISDKASGRTAFIGCGFRDGATATELRSAVQDSLRFLDREREARRLQALDGFDSDEDDVGGGGAGGGDQGGEGGSLGKAHAASKLGLAEGQTLKLAVGGLGEKHHHHQHKKHTRESDAAAFAALALPPSASSAVAAAPAAAAAAAAAAERSTTQPGEGEVVGDDDDWGDFTAAPTAISGDDADDEDPAARAGATETGTGGPSAAEPGAEADKSTAAPVPAVTMTSSAAEF